MSLVPFEADDFVWAGGYEDTFVPQSRPGLRSLEEYELTQHYDQWRADLDRAAALGIKMLRWGVPWYRVEPKPGRFDWSWVDEVFNYMIDKLNLEPIIDLVHYGTALWLQDSFNDPGYASAVGSYARAFAQRYGDRVRYFTPLNEPTVTAEFAGRKGQWPPYLTGDAGYVKVLLNAADGMQQTVRNIAQVAPQARFIAVEAMHLYRAMDARSQEQARFSFYQDLLAWDLVRGAVQHGHPLFTWLKQNGATDQVLRALQANGVKQHVFGVNFYPWSTADLRSQPDGSVVASPGPQDGRLLATVLKLTYQHTFAPMFITETSSTGDTTQRRLWMSETIDAVRLVRSQGYPVFGYTWFPLMTMIGWEYRTDDKPIAEHLLHLGLWDSSFDNQGTLVRNETPLVATYRDWVNHGMAAVAPSIAVPKEQGRQSHSPCKCRSILACVKRWICRLLGLQGIVP